MKPIIAIIGRPNVGKSTLLNRLARRKVSLVADTPGVTRDRNYAETQLSGRDVLLVDTGGFEPAPATQLEKSVVMQAQIAIDEADIVFFVCDAKDGLHPHDHTIANMLIKKQIPTFCLVNKCDPGATSTEFWDFYRLGIELISISAAHGTGLSELDEKLGVHFNSLPLTDPCIQVADLRLCFLGKPNVGKSSLVNRLIGENRQLVSNTPGTTRDAVDIVFEDKRGSVLLVDTPGVRRKRNIIKESIERLSVMAAFRSIERSDVAVAVLDATESFSDQDAKLLSLAHDRGNGLVVVVNKIDLLSGDQIRKYLVDLKYKMRFVAYASVLRVSALTGTGVAKILTAARVALRNAQNRVTTGILNKFLNDAVDTLQPASIKGRRAKLNYMTQVSIGPPTFVVWVNNPDLVAENYRRFLENRLRKQIAFTGTPLRWIFKQKRQK